MKRISSLGNIDRSSFELVKLLNIPAYTQGTHDSLCAYYAGAMMLTAFYPYREVDFGEMVDDPMISNYVGNYSRGNAKSKKQKLRNILSRWYFGGENLDAVTKTLNKAVRGSPFSTSFEYSEKNRKLGTFEFIANEIDEGLPVVVGWDTEDLGCHAVLVTGYKLGNDPWILINDPGSGPDEQSWTMLSRISQSRLELISCSLHNGPRPDKLVVGKNGTIVENNKPSVIYRWTPSFEYEDLEWMFDPSQVS